SSAAHTPSSSRARTTSGGGLATFTNALGLTKTKSREQQHNAGATSLPVKSLPNWQSGVSTELGSSEMWPNNPTPSGARSGTKRGFQEMGVGVGIGDGDDPFARLPVYASKDKPESPVPGLATFKFPDPSAPRPPGSWLNDPTDAPLLLTSSGPPRGLSSSPESLLFELSPESANLQRAPWLTTPITSGRLFEDGDSDTYHFDIAPPIREDTQSIGFSESGNHSHEDEDGSDDDSDEGLVFHNGLTDSLHYVSANSSRYGVASSHRPLPCPTSQPFMAGNVRRSPILNALAAVTTSAPSSLASPPDLRYKGESKEEEETKQLYPPRSFHPLKKFPSLNRQLSLPDSIRKPRGCADTSASDEEEREELPFPPPSPSSIGPSERILSMFTRSRTSSCTSIALDSITLRTIDSHVASSKHSRTASYSDSELEFERSSCSGLTTEPTKHHDIALTQMSVVWRCGGGSPKKCCGTRAIMEGLNTGQYECCAGRTPSAENSRCCASFVGRPCGSLLSPEPNHSQNMSLPAMSISQPVQGPQRYVQSVTSDVSLSSELLESPPGLPSSGVGLSNLSSGSSGLGSSILSIVSGPGSPPIALDSGLSPPPYISSCPDPVPHTTSDITTTGLQHRPSCESYKPSPMVQREHFTPLCENQIDFLEFGAEESEEGEAIEQSHSSRPALQHLQSFSGLGSRYSLIPELIQGSRGCLDTSVSDEEEQEGFLTAPSSPSVNLLDRISSISMGSQTGLCNSNIPNAVLSRMVGYDVKFLRHMRTASYPDSELEDQLSSHSGPTSKSTEHPIKSTQATASCRCGAGGHQECCVIRAMQEANAGWCGCHTERTPSGKDAQCCASFVGSPRTRSDVSSTSAALVNELEWAGIPKDAPDPGGSKHNRGFSYLPHTSHGNNASSVLFDDGAKVIIQSKTSEDLGPRLLASGVFAVTAPVSGSLASPPTSLVNGQEHKSKPTVSPARLDEHLKETHVLVSPAPGLRPRNSPQLELGHAGKPTLDPWRHIIPYPLSFVQSLITALDGPLFRGFNSSHPNYPLMIVDRVGFSHELCKYFQLAILGDERHSAAPASELTIEYQQAVSFPLIGGPSQGRPGACPMSVYDSGEAESSPEWRRQDKIFEPWDVGDRIKRSQGYSLGGSGWVGWKQVRGGGREVIPLPGLQGTKNYSDSYNWEPSGSGDNPLGPNFPGFRGFPNGSGSPNVGGAFQPGQGLGPELLQESGLDNNPFQFLGAIETALNMPTGQFQYQDGGDSAVQQPGYSPPPPVPLSANTRPNAPCAAWNAGYVAGCGFATRTLGGTVRWPKESDPEWDEGFVAGCAFADRTSGGSPPSEPRQQPDPTGTSTHVAPSMPATTAPHGSAHSLSAPAGPVNPAAPPPPSHTSRGLVAPVMDQQPHDQPGPSSTSTVTHGRHVVGAVRINTSAASVRKLFQEKSDSRITCVNMKVNLESAAVSRGVTNHIPVEQLCESIAMQSTVARQVNSREGEG
ncbi:hypothetical protein FRC11_006360, partial [Ceratobasidium sp. 423]